MRESNTVKVTDASDKETKRNKISHLGLKLRTLDVSSISSKQSYIRRKKN